MREEGSGARQVAPRFFLSWAQPAFRAPTQVSRPGRPPGSHAVPRIPRGPWALTRYPSSLLAQTRLDTWVQLPSESSVLGSGPASPREARL